MRNIAQAVVLVLVIVLGAATALADRIDLKSGTSLEGKILSETKDAVTIQVVGVGTLTIEREKILAIQRSEPEPGSGDGTVPAGTGMLPGGQPLIPEPTPEEKAEIDRLIEQLGDSRQAGGAGGRREQATLALIEFGPMAIPELNGALRDGTNWYRRSNAARAIAGIARRDGRIPLYEETVPLLIQNLYDTEPWVRIYSNEALETVSGKSVGYVEPPGPEIAPAELAAVEAWGRWWDEVRATLGTAPPPPPPDVRPGEGPPPPAPPGVLPPGE